MKTIKNILRFLFDFTIFILIISGSVILVTETGLLDRLGTVVALILAGNIFVPLLIFYFSHLRADDGGYEYWEDLFNIYMWISGIAMVVHSTIGISGTKNGKSHFAPPLWTYGKDTFIKGVTIYLIFYLTWVILYLIAKKKKWRVPFGGSRGSRDKDKIMIKQSNTSERKSRKKNKKRYGLTKKKK